MAATASEPAHPMYLIILYLPYPEYCYENLILWIHPTLQILRVRLSIYDTISNDCRWRT
jgi:hypothetical protein